MISPRTVTALSGGAIAGGLGVAVKRDSTTRINRAVRRRIHPRRSAPLRSVAKGISYLVGPHTHPFAAAALVFLIRRKERSSGLGPGAASLGALAVDNAMRLFVHQRRPPKASPHHGRNRYGYPSGHVTAATAIAIASAGEIADQLSPRERKLLWTAVAALSISVGWSRLYLDEHWIDDVVGGWMAGIGLGVASISLGSSRK
ncbi:MAG: phosphatase PAP2 family protein [Gemmatimonadota bacterium]|nr:phosphatase PAP2 family protein [Gemmatimonadota bacterium]